MLFKNVNLNLMFIINNCLYVVKNCLSLQSLLIIIENSLGYKGYAIIFKFEFYKD